MIDDLIELGFKKVVKYSFTNNRIIEKYEDFSQQDCLYAITTETEVLYIGKTDNFSMRLEHHKKELLEKIKNQIDTKEVTIYVLNFETKIYLNMLERYIAAGLERSLIRKFKPLFNTQYSSTTSEAIKDKVDEIIKEITGNDLIAKKNLFPNVSLPDKKGQYFFIELKKMT